jgi:hypothetical protein
VRLALAILPLLVAVAAADMQTSPPRRGMGPSVPPVPAAPGTPGGTYPAPGAPAGGAGYGGWGTPGGGVPDDGRRPLNPWGADVWVPTPIYPYEHEWMYWKHRSPKDLVPGTVTIDRAAYVCDLDGEKFDDADRFVAHLRVRHAVPPDMIRDVLVEVDGIYHYTGE